jgi:hypothetical protein
MERQYLELWADASWKLRRLLRFESQIWENDGLDEDTRLLKLERVLRLQATVRRQLDKAVGMLSKVVPETQERYARRAVLASKHLTESDVREDSGLAAAVEMDVQADILGGVSLCGLDKETLDNAPTHKNCQNEPAALLNIPFPAHRDWPFSPSEGGKVAKPERGQSEDA